MNRTLATLTRIAVFVVLALAAVYLWQRIDH